VLYVYTELARHNTSRRAALIASSGQRTSLLLRRYVRLTPHASRPPSHPVIYVIRLRGRVCVVAISLYIHMQCCGPAEPSPASRPRVAPAQYIHLSVKLYPNFHCEAVCQQNTLWCVTNHACMVCTCRPRESPCLQTHSVPLARLPAVRRAVCTRSGRIGAYLFDPCPVPNSY
jgi:hypothetical protein